MIFIIIPMTEPLLNRSDFSVSDKTIIDRYHNANIFSRLIFAWTYKVLRTAKKKSLKVGMLGVLPESQSSQAFLEEIKKVWIEKGYKSKASNALFKALLRVNMGTLIFACLLALFIAGLDILVVISFREYISYFEDKTSVEFSIYIIGPVLLVTKLLSAILTHQNTMILSVVGYKSSVQLEGLIYDKILRVSGGPYSEGEITNFLQIDSQKLIEFLKLLPAGLVFPFQLAGYSYLLFQYFKWTFIFSLGATFIMFAIVHIVMKKYAAYEDIVMKARDDRMIITTQTLNCLKILKLYSWDQEFLWRIEEKRIIELSKQKKILQLEVYSMLVFWSTPVITSIVAIGAHQYFIGQISTANILGSITIFGLIAEALWSLPMCLTSLYDTLVGLSRIQLFLLHSEIDQENLDKNYDDNGKIAISIAKTTFVWKDEEEEDKNIKSSLQDEEQRTFAPESKEAVKPFSLVDINFEIKKGELVAVIGEVGSGKSSLLQAILNNMIVKDKVDDSNRIHVNGKISYVAQIPWIQNDTLRNNIVFFNGYNEDKYNNIVNFCELKQDIESLMGKDLTEIGEKGINLSGGQKVRVSIARALYTDSDIYMFDDPLSALDAHVGGKIFDQVIKGYLEGKTRIIVTHALQYLNKVEKIIYMSKGTIMWTGSYNELIVQPFFGEFKERANRKSEIVKEITHVKDNSSYLSDEEEEEDDKKMTDEVKRITKDEEKGVGSTTCKVYSKFINYLGGISVFLITLFLMMLWQAAKIGSNIMLTEWSKMDDLTPDDSLRLFGIFSALSVSSSIFIVLRAIIVMIGVLRLSRLLHKDMINSIVYAPINHFHDTVPKGQLLNRLSKDLIQISDVAYYYGSVFTGVLDCVGSVIICAIYEVYSLIFIPIFIILTYVIYRTYVSTGRDLRRIEGVSRSPIVSLTSETINGAVTIRAFNYEGQFRKQFFKRLDNYFLIKLFDRGTSNWFSLHINFCSLIFLTFLIVLSIVFESDFNSQSIGLILTYSLFLSENILHLMYYLTEFQRAIVSLERCDKYTSVPGERPYNLDKDMEIADSWPSQGNIRFEKFSVKYRPDTEIILKDLSFDVLGSQKIGVVGRTGSGKSTLCLCLFRILEPLTGTIYIDDVDIANIGLSKLRSNLTIIPQDPMLFEGTLRYNIDPLGLYSDGEVLSILQKIGFSNAGESCSDNTNYLDTEVKESGDNLSVGERQLICICRAILRRSKVVVMDEATSSIDTKTEALIQTAIDSYLNQSTVITIAHRIKTVLHYDKILVLSKGEMVEFDSPQKLIQNKSSLFYELYTQSHLGLFDKN